MDVFNRLKSVVTNVLPIGNQITNDYEILGHKASGGPGMLWKIYDAVDKSTKQEVSVFILEKKLLDRFPKSIAENVLDTIKKGVSQLTKLRHPKILSVVHSLEDSKESLAFATESIFSSLANVLGFHDNLPTPPPSHLKNFEFFDLEVRYGLLQVVEALSFLHNSAHIIHGNCCPESIFINRYGCWKLAGFEFCILSSNSEGNPYYSLREYNTKMDPLVQPKLNYLAPEYGLSGYCDTQSDMYSVAMLMCALHNKGRTIYDCMGDWQNYKRNVAELRNLNVAKIESIPDSMRNTIKLLLNVEPSVRPDALQFTKLAYFEEVGVMTLVYLDLLVQKDNLQKSQFFKGLPSIVAKLPIRVNLQRVLPCLAKESSVPNMVPFMLPIIFEIAKQASKEEFSQSIFPVLVPLLKITEPIQVMLIFLQNMNTVLNKTGQADIRNHVLPMISRALDADMPQLRDLSLNIIPTFANLVEQSSLKNAIVPKICKLYTSQLPLATRVNSLVCLGQLLEHLDKWYVLDEILPVLQSMPCREPAILMSILGIYKIALNHKKLGITKEIIANQIIPFLFPMIIENTLNLSQFNTYMSVISDMISRVENEQRKKLQQLDSVQQENKTLERLAQEAMNDSTYDKNNMPDTEMGDFMKTIGLSVSCNEKMKNNIETSPSKQFNIKPVELTMQEKASLAQQQDLLNRMKTDHQLQPKPMSQHVNKTQTKDLSSSLIANNLANLSMNANAQKHAANNISFTQMNSQQPNYSTQNFINANNNPGSLYEGFKSSSKPVDLTAFDSLNVMGINQAKNISLPMNQLSQPTNYMQNSQGATPFTYNSQNSQILSNPFRQPLQQPYAPMNVQSASYARAPLNTIQNKDIDDLLG